MAIDVNSLTPSAIPPIVFFKDGKAYAVAHDIPYAVRVINEIFNSKKMAPGRVLMMRIPMTDTRKMATQLTAVLHTSVKPKAGQLEYYTVGMSAEDQFPEKYSIDTVKEEFIKTLIKIHKSAYKSKH